jgi:polar amino acid transport system substrate-binding protein
MAGADLKAFLTLIMCTLLSSPAWAFTLCIEDADYSPYLIGNSDSSDNGMLPHMIRAAAKDNQEPLKIVAYPWKRCIDMLSKGQTDALAASIWIPEREAWGAFPKLTGQPQGAPDRSKRLWSGEYPVFVAPQGTLSYDGKQFSGVKTGLSAPSGYVAWQRLKDAGVLYQDVLQPKAGLKLVALNRLDGYVVERHIGQHMLDQMGLTSQVTTLPTPYIKDDWYLVFSHQFQTANPDLTQRIWTSLGKIREEQGAELLRAYQQ